MPAVDYSVRRRGQHRIYADDAWKDSSASVAETDDSAVVMSVESPLSGYPPPEISR